MRIGFKCARTETVDLHLEGEQVGEILTQVLKSHMKILHVTNQAGLHNLTMQSSSSHLEKHINLWRYTSNQREKVKAIKSKEKCVIFSMIIKGGNTYSNRAVSIPIHKFLMKVQQKNRPDIWHEIERRKNVRQCLKEVCEMEHFAGWKRLFYA